MLGDVAVFSVAKDNFVHIVRFLCSKCERNLETVLFVQYLPGDLRIDLHKLSVSLGL
jgi:hypothetical protein